MKLKEYLSLEKDQRNPFKLIRKKKKVRSEILESDGIITLKFKRVNKKE